MVTKSKYISLLEASYAIDNNLVNSLEELQHKYPYCGSIQMLLSKGYHTNSNIKYEEQLQNTAISIPNRENLYKLIYKSFITQKINEKIKTEPLTNSQTETINETAVKQQIPVQEIVKEKQIDKNDDKLEELILSHAIGSSYKLADEEELLNNKIAEPKEIKEVTKKLKEQDSFYSWLTPKEPIPSNQNSNKESINSLVEKFIKSKENEKIERKDFFSPTNIAKISIVDKNDFVTETLADIYFKQNMFDKALKAYEKLILKNPEKKPYFASQIKKIKNLLT